MQVKIKEIENIVAKEGGVKAGIVIINCMENIRGRFQLIK